MKISHRSRPRSGVQRGARVSSFVCSTRVFAFLYPRVGKQESDVISRDLEISCVIFVPDDCLHHQVLPLLSRVRRSRVILSSVQFLRIFKERKERKEEDRVRKTPLEGISSSCYRFHWISVNVFFPLISPINRLALSFSFAFPSLSYRKSI